MSDRTDKAEQPAITACVPYLPVRDAAASIGRRGAPETVGEPDWHNRRAALLLGIEEALDQAPDDRSRAALIDRLRRAME